MTPIQFWPGNTRTFIVDAEYTDQVTARDRPLTTGAVTGFLATSADPTAIAADPSLSVSAVYLGGRKWRVTFDGSVLTSTLLHKLFGVSQPVRTVVTDHPLRADSTTSMGASDSGHVWLPEAGTFGIISGGPSGKNLYSPLGDGTEADNSRIATVDAGIVGAYAAYSIDAYPTVNGPINGKYLFLIFAGISRADFAAIGIVSTPPVGFAQFAWKKGGTENPLGLAACNYTAAVGDRVAIAWDAVNGIATFLVNGVVQCVQRGLGAWSAGTRYGWGVLEGASPTHRINRFEASAAALPTPYLIVEQLGGFRTATPLQYLPSRPDDDDL